jgi:hypothetical protein
MGMMVVVLAVVVVVAVGLIVMEAEHEVEEAMGEKEEPPLPWAMA